MYDSYDEADVINNEGVTGQPGLLAIISAENGHMKNTNSTA